MSDWSNQPFIKPVKKKPVRQNQSFVEALKGIGGYTLKSAKDDLLKPIGQDMVSALTGAPPWSSSAESGPTPDRWPSQWYERQEKEQTERLARERRHQEVIAQPVYDRRQEEVKAQIEAIQTELQALAKELGSMGSSIQKAIDEEISSPGTYHLHFFAKLRRFIILLRQQVTDSQNWLQLSYARRAAKNHYWGGVTKAGTKFMLSSERTPATAAG